MFSAVVMFSAAVTFTADVMVTSSGNVSLTDKRSVHTLKKWATLHGKVHEGTHLPQHAQENMMSVSVQGQLQVVSTIVHLSVYRATYR